MTTLVDSNVIIDIQAGNPSWVDWSSDQLTWLRRRGALVISDVTFAELAAGYDTERDLRSELAAMDIVLEHIPDAALFRAGRAFRAYREAGGVRHSLLPDFFIGAHAAVRDWPILTRDVRRYRAYFPGVSLIAPQAD